MRCCWECGGILCRGDVRVFVDIAGHPGYRVGTTGVIQSDVLIGSKARTRTGTWRDLKPYLNKRTGYHSIDLHTGIRRNARVNVVVISAFVCPRPDGMECRHRDGNRLNNWVGNLLWGTRSDNMQDAIRHGTIKRGIRQENAKLDDDKVRDILRRLKAGEGQRSLAREFNISRSVLGQIASRKAWRHVEEV
jgi:hypothetical protein